MSMLHFSLQKVIRPWYLSSYGLISFFLISNIDLTECKLFSFIQYWLIQLYLFLFEFDWLFLSENLCVIYLVKNAHMLLTVRVLTGGRVVKRG